MTTTIRPEISSKNKYWINKHRHYELKHFCLQYPEWIRKYRSIDNLGSSLSNLAGAYSRIDISDTTAKCAIRRAYYADKIKLVERAAREADELLCDYILKGVTEGLSFTYLKTILQIPCSRDLYYDRYRKFFWILSNIKS